MQIKKVKFSDKKVKNIYFDSFPKEERFSPDVFQVAVQSTRDNLQSLLKEQDT